MQNMLGGMKELAPGEGVDQERISETMND